MILTKPTNVYKGSPALFTLNKEELANHSAITDLYYQDSSNWQKVSFVYTSSTGNQSEVVAFDASQETPTKAFEVSLRARSQFKITNILIFDFDKAFFSISRDALSEVERSELDVSVL